MPALKSTEEKHNDTRPDDASAHGQPQNGNGVHGEPPVNKPHVTTFFVDNEEIQTDQKTLMVREILAKSENTPVENFSLMEEKNNENPAKRYDDLDEEINVHEKQRFVALFKGATPVSSNG